MNAYSNKNNDLPGGLLYLSDLHASLLCSTAHFSIYHSSMREFYVATLQSHFNTLISCLLRQPRRYKPRHGVTKDLYVTYVTVSGIQS